MIGKFTILLIGFAIAQGPPVIQVKTPTNQELDLPTDFQFDANMETYGEMIISLDLTKEGGIGIIFKREDESRDIRVDFQNNKFGIIEDGQNCQKADLDLLTILGIEITIGKLNEDRFKPLEYSHTEIIQKEKYYVYKYNMMALIVLQNLQENLPKIELLFSYDKGRSGKHTLSFIRIQMKEGVADVTLTVPLLNSARLRGSVGFTEECEDSGMNQEEMADFIKEEMSQWLF